MILADKDPTCVYVVRHGQTVLNAEGKFRGNANPPLDKVGLADARRLATLFSDIPVSCIFTSDRQRAVTTAQTIAKEKDLPIHLTSNLRALNIGEFSGKDRNPETEGQLQSYLADPDTQIPGGESLNDFRSRVMPCIQEALDIFADCGVPPILVAHSSIVHEVGNQIHGNHKSVLVQPGGVLAIYVRNGVLDAQPVYRPLPKDEQSSQGKTIS